MKTIRFLMVGGFLGAGKTTTIAKLASHYTAAGKTVALVTNDQAYDLVDTHTLRSKGFHVGEVPGACFCCNFEDLIETVESLSKENIPDIVIAEPVGSCTDLVATVIQPMKELLGERFELGPFVVLLKPEHGRKILSPEKGKGFSPKAEYIFLKQLEEADAIVINKIDKLSAEQQTDLIGQVHDRFPGVPTIAASAREGTHLQNVFQLFDQPPRKRQQMMEVDYETYAQGEAELGWFNCTIEANAAEKFSLDELVLALVKETGSLIDQSDNHHGVVEIAHLKVIGQTLHDAAVANLVDSGGVAELSLASEIKTDQAQLLVNARVAASPEQLEDAVTKATDTVGQRLQITLELSKIQSFRPEPPTPTHRVGTS